MLRAESYYAVSNTAHLGNHDRLSLLSVTQYARRQQPR